MVLRRFESSSEDEPTPPTLATTPAGPPASTAPAPAPTRSRPRQAGTAALVALALAVGSVGGGFVGATAAARVAPPAIAVAAPAAVPAPQLTALQAQPVSPTNVAGSVFARANPAVVQLVVSGRAPGGPMQSGSGSGVVVDARGYILTNNHVVEGARGISVRFSTGTTREATVLGTDRGNDLALLKVDLPEGTPVAPLGDSDAVEVGEVAIAIGSPFGLDQSVTQGIISATRRTWQPDNGRVRRNLLQTDAPINPGNSGGPLLNARGEVIGINTMIESPVRGSVGVGFAVPINLAKRLMPQLEAGARLEPVWLGISGLALDQATARDQGLSVQEGVLVTGVVPGGPAARAGVQGGQAQGERIPRGGDVIVALDGTPIKDMLQLTDQLAGRGPGQTITLTVLRGGQRQDLRVTLQAWPAETP